MKIMLAEDDAHTRFSVSLALRKAGHEVMLASSGNEALRQIRDNAEQRCAGFDVVVTDLNMPDGNGWDLLAGMEKMGCRAPVVVITAYGSKDVETALKRHANVTLLRKPFGAELVATTVEEARSAFQRKNDNSDSV